MRAHGSCDHSPIRGNVDDPARALLHHARHHGLRAKEAAFAVDVEHALNHLGRYFLSRQMLADPRVVDQNVNNAQLAAGFGDQFSHRFRVCHAVVKDDGALAQSAHRRSRGLGFLLKHVMHDDVSAARRHQFGMCAAHTAAGAGNPGNLAVQTSRVSHGVCPWVRCRR